MAFSRILLEVHFASASLHESVFGAKVRSEFQSYKAAGVSVHCVAEGFGYLWVGEAAKVKV